MTKKEGSEKMAKLKAVVVDDEPIVRMDFAEMLRELDMDVPDTGTDGFDAVELCRKHRPDLMLLDIKMPVFDGLDAAHTILREFPETCVVLITAFSDDDFISRAREIGVAGYLVKPVDERNLKSALEIALSQHRRYQNALRETRNMEEKLRAKQDLEKARYLLAKMEHISEGEAYSRMQRMSMDKRCSLEEIARRLIQVENQKKETLNRAKAWLMDRYAISDRAAYERIRSQSVAWDCTVYEAAEKIAFSERNLILSC